MAKQSKAEIEERKDLEERGALVGFNPDGRNSVEDMREGVEAAEKAALEAKAIADNEAVEAKAIAEQDAANDKATDEAEQAQVNPDHEFVVVADAITSLRGILVKGTSCESRDFPGAEPQLAEMIKKKLIKKA